jgi:RNA binding exosome subunit
LSIFDEVKKALETFIAPDLQQVKADVKVINGKLDNMEKMNELRFKQIDQRFDDLIERLDLKHKIDDLQRRVAQQEVKQ